MNNTVIAIIADVLKIDDKCENILSENKIFLCLMYWFHIPAFYFFLQGQTSKCLYRVHQLKGCVFPTYSLLEDSPLSLLIGENSHVFALQSPESDSPALTVSKISADQSDLVSKIIGTKAFPAPPPLDFPHAH